MIRKEYGSKDSIWYCRDSECAIVYEAKDLRDKDKIYSWVKSPTNSSVAIPSCEIHGTPMYNAVEEEGVSIIH